MKPVLDFYCDKLRVRSYETRREMGEAAAEAGAALLRVLLEKQRTVRVVFAAAPSQKEFLSALCEAPGISWERVVAFHMDEYIGLPQGAPQGFGNFLSEHIFHRLPFGAVHLLNGQTDDVRAECERYAALLEQAPIDLVFLGIGENGHIAFNDPPVADFEDPQVVKVVTLDGICRNQQVNDGCFAELDQVPTQAMTLTVPALVSAKHHICIVPAPAKAQAVERCLHGKIGTACPATVLRVCADAALYLDADSSALLHAEMLKASDENGK